MVSVMINMHFEQLLRNNKNKSRSRERFRQCAYIITIIHAGVTIPRPFVNVNIVSEEFYSNSITVVLEWNEEIGVTYDVAVYPNVTKTFKSKAGLHLSILYNVQYTVNVEASLCGQLTFDVSQLLYG